MNTNFYRPGYGYPPNMPMGVPFATPQTGGYQITNDQLNIAPFSTPVLPQSHTGSYSNLAHSNDGWSVPLSPTQYTTGGKLQQPSYESYTSPGSPPKQQQGTQIDPYGTKGGSQKQTTKK